jgi:TP901 family phage tail tape measure protein
MAKNTLTQRIALDGGDAIRQELQALGSAGEKAFRQLQRAADQLKGPSTGFEARLKAIQAQFKTIARDFSVAGEKIAAAGRNLTAAITLPIAGAGIASIKAAADFESGFSNIATAIDTSKESIAEMEQSVLDLGKRVPVSLADLTDALYDIRSAGIDAADAMTVLEGSAKLAVAGLGTTKEAADVATSAINAFGLKGADQAKIYNLFFDAINTGKTTLSGLAQGFGNVAGTVHAAGVQLDDFLAAVAALTTTGETASVAYTQIQQTIAGLTRQTKDSQKVFAELGVKTFSDLIRKSGGFVAALNRIVKATGGDTATILKLVGSTEALNAVLQLTGAQGKAYVETLDLMRSGTDSLTGAFDKQSKTINSQFTVLQNNLKAVAVSFGKLLLPAAQKFADAAERIVAVVDNLDGRTKGLIATWGGYAAAAGPVLIGLGLLSKAISFVFRGINELIGSTRIIYQLLKTNPYVRVAAIILSVGEAFGLFKNKQETAADPPARISPH